MPVYTSPSKSQEASAICHLDRADEWSRYRYQGVRYVTMTSGRTNHVYQVRADARGCSCPWYQRTGQTCSHMIALRTFDSWTAAVSTEIEAALEDLSPVASWAEVDAACAGVYADGRARYDAAVRADQVRQAAAVTAPRPTYADLFPEDDN